MSNQKNATTPPPPEHLELRDSVLRLIQNEHFARQNFFASDHRSDSELTDDILALFQSELQQQVVAAEKTAIRKKLRHLALVWKDTPTGKIMEAQLKQEGDSHE